MPAAINHCGWTGCDHYQFRSVEGSRRAVVEAELFNSEKSGRGRPRVHLAKVIRMPMSDD